MSILVHYDVDYKSGDLIKWIVRRTQNNCGIEFSLFSVAELQTMRCFNNGSRMRAFKSQFEVSYALAKSGGDWIEALARI